MLIVKRSRKLRGKISNFKIHSKPCFCGFSESMFWGKVDLEQELRAYENWLKEL